MVKTAESSSMTRLKIVHTSDVHGHFFMWDCVNRKAVRGGLSRVYAYVQSLRKSYGSRLLLMDGGDILQGSPLVYYSHFMPSLTEGEGLAAGVMNYMGYDVATVGNHDIETGHAVYDRWAAECRFPVVAANIIDRDTGRCHFRPYTVVERGGVRVAVLGLVTPAVPNWLPPALWRGMEFEDMVDCASRWVPFIREKESPDVIVGLFHSGKEGGIVTSRYAENAALDVARRVDGFDVVCYGHDHLKNCETVEGPSGKKVVCCSPSSMAVTVCEVDLEIETGPGGKQVRSIRGKLTDLSHYKAVEAGYMQKYFERYVRNTDYYVSQKIGRFTRTICSQDAYFGPSAFVDLVHRAQLEITGAQVSFAAPVTFSAEIKAGDVCVRDVFNLYKYDDVLYTMRLTGAEIKGILEMSYGLWVEQMRSPQDHAMLLDYVLDEGRRLGFKNLAYNFDSAAGIFYAVDLTQPCGKKVTVLRMADGSLFDESAQYTVAVNSYRGSGGGDLFIKGAGIPRGCLSERLLSATDKNLRQCLVEYIRNKGTIDPCPLNCWRFVPEEWAVPACQRDRVILFGQPEAQ